MNCFEALLFFMLVLLQSTRLAVSAAVDNDERINSQLGGGGGLRGKPSPPSSEGSHRKLFGNVFSKNKSKKKNVATSQRWHKSSKSSSTKHHGVYSYAAKGKGHYYNYKGYSYKGKGTSKGKGSLPDSSFITPKSKGSGLPKGTWITKGKGVPIPKGKGGVIAKGKGTPVSKGNGNSICGPKTIAVESFQLVDDVTGERFKSIFPGEELNLAELGRQYGTTDFAVECVTRSLKDASVGSVRLTDNFGGGYVDSVAPWILPTPLEERPGFWHVMCQPYCDPFGSGNLGTPGSIYFKAITGNVIPSQPSLAPVPIAPVPQPTSAPFLPTTTTPTTAPVPRPTLPPVAFSPPTSSPVLSQATMAPVAMAVPSSAPIRTIAPTNATSPTTTTVPVSAPTQTPLAGVTLQPTTSNSTAPASTNDEAMAVRDKSALYGLQRNCRVFDDSAFNICLDISSQSGEVEPWFDLILEAANRWERIIAGDPWGPWTKDILEYLPESNIATTLPGRGVDDIYISVFERNIDGEGGLFALAGPDLIVGDENSIVAGSIQIDPNDLAVALEKNVFLPLMLHEIGHVLGVGTMWEDHGLIDTVEQTYIGPHALEAWHKKVGCSGNLPLSGNHWNEDCVDDEFMTPFFKFNRPAPVSSLTLGTLEDLGYQVNRDEEDPFGVENLGECDVSACPEATNHIRRLESRDNSATIENKLSLEGEQAVLVAAANHFQRKSVGVDANKSSHNVVSLLYQENGNFHSRIVSKSQTVDLLI